MAGKVYASKPIVHGELTFAPGDELQGHFSPEALAALVKRREASEQAPADLRPAWALVALSYRPHTAGYDFRRGDRVDGRLPADVLAACVKRGEVGYEKPKDVDPIYATEAVSHKPHGSGPDFTAGQRIDGEVPDDVLAGWLKSGHATRDEPRRR